MQSTVDAFNGGFFIAKGSTEHPLVGITDRTFGKLCALAK